MRNGAKNDIACGRANRASLLLDGAGYFGALRSSLLKAQRSICLVGWDIDSRTPLRGETSPQDGAPELLGEFLTYLVDRNEDLTVYILLWDFSVLYALEREPLPRLNLDWRTPSRVKVCLDRQLPFGCSNHEKLAVIDDSTAYCGGLDLTIRRWDKSAHRTRDALRKDPRGAPYGPYHDAQFLVDHEAARRLAKLVRERWRTASGYELDSIDVNSDAWPDGVEPDLRHVRIAIKRTRPEYDGESQLRQVEEAYLKAISCAERFIYIENQYLTAGHIATAIRRRLIEQPSLEVLIVSSLSPDGWLEEQTMGVGRARFMRQFTDEEIAERVAFVFPWTGPEKEPIKVHAKLMITDDCILHIGSSNLNYRSMGVDRECDLHVEAESEKQRRSIENVRRRLMSHLTGVPAATIESREASGRSMLSIIDEDGSTEHGLSRIEDLRQQELPTDVLVDLGDPERPIDPEKFMGNLFGARPTQSIWPQMIRLLAVTVLILTMLLVWNWSPLSQWATPEVLADWFGEIESNPLAGPICVAAFVLGSLVVFPVTVLIAMTAIALGSWQGLVWASAGAMLAAAVNYASGYMIPDAVLQRWSSSLTQRINERLQSGSIVAIALLRSAPIAPFTAINLVAGAVRVSFRSYMIGTALGMAPVVLALTLLGDRLRIALQDFSWTNGLLLSLAIGLWVGIAIGLQLLSNRLADER